MPVVKVSVSIEAADLAWAKKRAKREKIALSKVLTDMIAEQRRMEALDDVLAEMAKHGPPVTQEEIDAVIAEQEGRDARGDVRRGRSDRARARTRGTGRATGARRPGQRKAA